MEVKFYMTWEIVVGLITLLGAIATIGKIVAANTKALTKLEDSIASLDNTLIEQRNALDKLDDKLDDHETRITVLEVQK